MAEIRSRPVLPNQRLRVASHIKVHRSFYYHHGIYVGRHQVIHYSGLSTRLTEKGQSQIVQTALEEFAGESTIEQVEYTSPLSRNEIIANAKERLGESGYHLFWNNCEHFATWCMTHESKSKQIRALVLGGFVSLQLHNLID
jgi:hypothetical protein